jgi:AhpD family alkylhydroperoxidase
MEPRITNPAMLIPGALESIQSLVASLKENGVEETTLELVHLRTSQINGCGVCLDMDVRSARKNEESLERLLTVAGWRDVPYFTESERAALALAEAMTRFNDRPDPVSDEVWAEAARHFDETALATLVSWIALVNLFNRVNVTTRQVPVRWNG